MKRPDLSCKKGAAAVELAFVAPVFLVLILGLMDIAQMLYVRAMLHGAIEETGRASTTEDADTDSLDSALQASVKPVAPDAIFTLNRESYYDFTDVGRAEKFTDANSNGTCDKGETYIDENGNSQWDADIGVSGNGGADDIVVYTASVSYTPFFQFPFYTIGDGRFTVSAKTVRKNQPFTSQTSYSTTTGTCS